MAISLKRKESDITKKITPKVKSAESGFDEEKVAKRYKKLQADLAAVVQDPKIKKMQDELAELKTALVDNANKTLKADEGMVIVTPLGDVKIGKRSTSRSITDMKKAVKLLGKETFMKIAKIGLTDLDKYLNPEELEQCVVVKITDTRRIT